MSSLIEQAANRLEQLRRAGISVPEVAASAAPPLAAVSPVAAKPAADMQHVQRAAAPVQVSKQVTLNLDELGAARIITPNGLRSRAADQYRVIKRPLIANVKGMSGNTLNHGNLIMVTSALVGEGKSFTAINLAMSIAAELDNTVMLVDADVARPSVLRVLGLPPGPGLLDLLEGKTDMASVLLKTNVDKLTILPSGTPHPKATELLASAAMRALLDDMAKRYADRIIIFDSPPLLLTTEARVLATQMGQIVMVVQADKTLQSDVQHSLSTIKGCSNIHLLLNKARGDSAGGYSRGFDYGYGYGYGYETRDGNPAT